MRLLLALCVAGLLFSEASQAGGRKRNPDPPFPVMTFTEPMLPQNGCVVNNVYVKDAQADICCRAGAGISPPPSGCPQPSSALTPLSNTMIQFAGAVASSSGVLGSATNLVSFDGSSTAIGAPALADMEPDADNSELSKSGIGTVGNSALDTLRNNRVPGVLEFGKGVGAGGSGSSYSGGASDYGAQSSPGSMNGSINGSMMAAHSRTGEGSPGLLKVPGGFSGSRDDFYGGSESVRGLGESKEKGALDLSGVSRSPALSDSSLSSMTSEDPSDYFSRIASNQSLFKTVEKRYTSKQKQWAMADSAALRRKSDKLATRRLSDSLGAKSR